MKNPKQYDLSERHFTPIEQRVCNGCWRPIALGKPIIWKTDRENMPHPYHVGCDLG